MTSAAGVRARPLVLLALAVLAAHLLLLRTSPPPPLAWSPLALPRAPAVRLLPPAAPPRAGSPADVAPPREPARSQPAPARHAAAAAMPASTATLAPAPITAPVAARWRYAVLALHRGIQLEGQGALDWRPSGGAYEAVLAIDVPGLPHREQRSTGEVLAGSGLRPQRFSERVRSEQAAHFDGARGQLLFSGNQPPAALLEGAQDRVSVIVQLLALARADAARMEPGASITVQVAGARGADAWTFAAERWESLDLPGGAVRALKLTRPPAREYDLRMELWIAPDYGPVRLRLTPPNGDWLDLQWSGTDKG